MSVHHDITVITPCFNCSEYIQRFYKRLRFISEDLKIIFIDDCSIDGTLNELEALSKKDRYVHVISLKKNIGPAGARIAGVQEAFTEFISFIDIDDIPSCSKFTAQVELMRKLGKRWSFHSRRLPSGVMIGKQIENIEDLYTRRYIGLSSVMITADVVPLICKDYGIRRGEDYIWWFNICNSLGLPLFVPDIFYEYNVSSGTLSSNKLRQAIAVFYIYIQPDLSKVTVGRGLHYFIKYLWFAVSQRVKYKVNLLTQPKT